MKQIRKTLPDDLRALAESMGWGPDHPVMLAAAALEEKDLALRIAAQTLDQFGQPGGYVDMALDRIRATLRAGN